MGFFLFRLEIYLVIFAGVSKEVSKEVETGTFSDEDEICGAVSQVGSRRQAFRAARTSTAHAGSIYSEELSSNRPPLATTLWMKKPQTDRFDFTCYCCQNSFHSVSKVCILFIINIQNKTKQNKKFYSLYSVQCFSHNEFTAGYITTVVLRSLHRLWD